MVGAVVRVGVSVRIGVGVTVRVGVTLIGVAVRIGVGVVIPDEVGGGVPPPAGVPQYSVPLMYTGTFDQSV